MTSFFNTQTNTLRSFAFAVVFFLTLLALGFASLDFLYSKIYFKEYQYDYLQSDLSLGWVPIAGLRMPDHPFGEIYINQEGFRSPEMIPKKNKALILGDSVAWGYGVGNKSTLSYHLSQKTSDSNYQILNLGVPGYGPDQYYLRLTNTFSSISNVKKAILILFQNDLKDLQSNLAYGKRKPFFTYNTSDSKLILHPITPQDLRFQITQSKLIQKILLRWPSGDALLGRLSGDFFTERAASKVVFMALMEEMQEFLDLHQVELTIALSPRKEDFFEKSDDFKFLEALLKKDFPRYINLLEELKNLDTDSLFRDNAHYSNEGNLQIAKILYSKLFTKELP